MSNIVAVMLIELGNSIAIQMLLMILLPEYTYGYNLNSCFNRSNSIALHFALSVRQFGNKDAIFSILFCTPSGGIITYLSVMACPLI